MGVTELEVIYSSLDCKYGCGCSCILCLSLLGARVLTENPFEHHWHSQSSDINISGQKRKADPTVIVVL